MRLKQGCKGAWIAVLAAVLDRISKAWALGTKVNRPMIPGILNARYMENTGMAFSMFSSQSLALTVLTIVLILALVSWLLAKPGEPKLFRGALWLIVGGGLGNLYDRLVYGYVIDFIELAFVRFAVFNVADACICVGGGLAVLAMIMEEFRGRKAHGK